MSAPALIVPVPRPLSADLRAAIEDAIRSIPPDKRGQATVAVSLDGVMAEVAVTPKDWLSVGGYAGRLWSGGWTAGAKAQATW